LIDIFALKEYKNLKFRAVSQEEIRIQTEIERTGSMIGFINNENMVIVFNTITIFRA